MQPGDFITRLAPSPTGALHLGNARTFLINWILARQNGWKIVLRIEDLDGPRIKREADGELLDDLAWLGLNWDAGPIHQSDRLARYKAAMQKLIAGQRAYACVCTRKEVETAASAPHAEDAAAIYPGTCRGRFASAGAARVQTGKPAAMRFRADDGRIDWEDGFSGSQRFDAARRSGDFVIAKADGTPAYQLAVVVDDAEMGVTHVVRGDDLLDSTPKQIMLYKALGHESDIPQYYHLPLVVGVDGRRLAKRHGDTRLSYYRNRGVPAQRVMTLLGRWCGIDTSLLTGRPQEMTHSFKLENVPRGPIVFRAEDDAWLLAGAS